MKQKEFSIILLIGAFILISLILNAQDPNRLKTEVDLLFNKEYNFAKDKKLVVFAGSSTIRKWENIQDYFPDYNVINNGFGGSEYSDLIYYKDKLLLKQTPDILFIYEGDNDIGRGKNPRIVAKEARILVQYVHKNLPKTRIVVITPKASIKRWEFKKEFEKLNKLLKRFPSKIPNLEIADAWSAFLDKNGMVYQDVFVQDNLHLNKKGYDLLAEVIRPFLK